MDVLARLPEAFWQVRYDFSRTPMAEPAGLEGGANCQRFAYAVLAHFGLLVPPLWSSELWADEVYTLVVSEFAPLDLLLFGRSDEAFGAHVAVCIDEGRALHLCKAVGVPVVWGLEAFLAREEYRVLIGGKRVRG